MITCVMAGHKHKPANVYARWFSGNIYCAQYLCGDCLAELGAFKGARVNFILEPVGEPKPCRSATIHCDRCDIEGGAR